MRILTLLTTLVTCLWLSACSTPGTGPVVTNVCITVPQETPQEVALVRRRAAEYLADYGFRLADSACEVEVKYDRFGAFQGESIVGNAFWVSRAGYWSQEGILTMTYAGKTVFEDQTVDLRGYSTKQDLLGGLAWSVVKPVIKTYRPGIPLKK